MLFFRLPKGADLGKAAVRRVDTVTETFVTHCSIGKNATQAHGKCQQAFLDAANKQNLTFLVQVRQHGPDTWNVLSAGACTASWRLCRRIFCPAVIGVNSN